MNFLHRSLCGFFLANALILLCPLPGGAQDAEGGLNMLELSLVGLTVDMRDGQDLGRGCRWDDDPEEVVGGGGCHVTVVTLRDAGVPLIDGTEIDLSRGVFGRERFRLAGRITSIDFQRTTSNVFNLSPLPVQTQEVYRDYSGKVVGRYAPQSNDLWGRQRVRIPQVRAQVVWSLYDSAESAMIAEREVKGLSTDLGSAIYDSLERFVDDVSDEMDGPAGN
ncbi:MAG: hypothetical protein E4H01_11770 [Lysobacterales bacterium]|nr:MAG: hypothetical protein E4H01_11770 [Xanthomonadales bacterium]